MTVLTLTTACYQHCQIMLCNTLADTGCGTLSFLLHYNCQFDKIVQLTKT